MYMCIFIVLVKIDKKLGGPARTLLFALLTVTVYSPLSPKSIPSHIPASEGRGHKQESRLHKACDGNSVHTD